MGTVQAQIEMVILCVWLLHSSKVSDLIGVTSELKEWKQFRIPADTFYKVVQICHNLGQFIKPY